jgi:hypothetical protein
MDDINPLQKTGRSSSGSQPLIYQSSSGDIKIDVRRGIGNSLVDAGARTVTRFVSENELFINI